MSLRLQFSLNISGFAFIERLERFQLIRLRRFHYFVYRGEHALVVLLLQLTLLLNMLFAYCEQTFALTSWKSLRWFITLAIVRFGGLCSFRQSQAAEAYFTGETKIKIIYSSKLNPLL